jgi:serine/threonine protein kinase
MDHTSRKSCPGKSVEHNEILRQVTERLAEIHSRGEVHGKHLSSLVAEILDSAGKLDISNESLSEWRPAEEWKTDLKPTKEGDVFSLGCYFYYVITGGQHAFGRSGQRALFIENNLYHLAGCRDQQLQTLIAKMISHDCTKRPNSSELLNHRFLWHSKKIEDYLTNVAENIDENSDQYNKWKGTILLSDKSIGVNRGQKKTAVKVKNVAAVLKEIKVSAA